MRQNEKTLLLKEFFLFAPKQNEAANQVIKRFYDRVHDIKVAGIEIPADQQMVILLEALSHDPMITERIIQLKEEVERGEGVQTISELEERVNHYLRIKKSSGKTAAAKPRVGAEANTVRFTCYACGRPGHIARNCPDNKSGEVKTTQADANSAQPRNPEVKKGSPTPKTAGTPASDGPKNRPKPASQKGREKRGQGKLSGSMHRSVNAVDQDFDEAFELFRYEEANMLRVEPSRNSIAVARTAGKKVTNQNDPENNPRVQAAARQPPRDRRLWAMMDSGASVHVVQSLGTVKDPAPLEPPIKINTVGGDLLVRYSGRWTGIGEALVNPIGGSNIVSLSMMLKDGYNITITDGAFRAEHPLAPKASMTFKLQRNGLFECPMSEIEEFGTSMTEGLAWDSYKERLAHMAAQGEISLVEEEDARERTMETYQANMNQQSSLSAEGGTNPAELFKQMARDQIRRMEEAKANQDQGTLTKLASEGQRIFQEIIDHYAGMIEAEDVDGNEKAPRKIQIQNEAPSMSSWMKRFAVGETPLVREGGIETPRTGNNTKASGQGSTTERHHEVQAALSRIKEEFNSPDFKRYGGLLSDDATEPDIDDTSTISQGSDRDTKWTQA